MRPPSPPAPQSAEPASSSSHATTTTTSYQQHPQQHHPPSPTLAPDERAYNEKSPSQHHHGSRASKSSHARGRDSVISHPWSPHASSPPSPRSSTSSTARRHRSFSAAHHAPHVIKSQSISFPPQAHLDPEKHGYYSLQSPRTPQRRSNPRADAVLYDQTNYQEKWPEDRAWQLLVRLSRLHMFVSKHDLTLLPKFYLSGPCALVSLTTSLWTIFAIMASLALAPLRLCCSRPSFQSQLTNLLGPALNLQLHLIYSHNSTHSYSSCMLVVVHLFSPIVALGIALAAWTAAAFWIFTSILGDPGGNDGHNDGKESILGVRNWWEKWLSRGLREPKA